MERTSKKEFIINVLYSILMIALVFSAVWLTFKYFLPFVIASLIAYAVQKPAIWLSKKVRISRGYTASILSILVYVSVILLFSFLLYRLAMLAVGLVDFLPRFFEKAEDVFGNIVAKISSNFGFLQEKFDIDFNSLLSGTLQKIGDKSVTWITSAIGGVFRKMPIYFVTAIVTLVATCFIAKDFEQLKTFVKTLIGKKQSLKFVKVKNIFFGSVLKLVRGYLLLAVLTFVQLYLGFVILKINNSLTLALIISAVDVLPVLGTGTILAPWAIFSALSGDYRVGIGLGILFIVVTLIRNFAEPKIIGMQIGINPLFTLISMFIGLKVLGVLGLVLFPIILIVVIKYYKDEMQEGLSE